MNIEVKEKENRGMNENAMQTVSIDPPLTIWYCDECGKPITNPDDGLVVWQSSDYGDSCCEFKVIHIKVCDLHRRKYRYSMNMPYFIGSDGLTYMLSFLSIGPLMAYPGYEGWSPPPHLAQYVDLVRRFHIPYYEQARQYFSISEVVEYYGDSDPGPYTEKNLKRIIQMGAEMKQHYA